MALRNIQPLVLTSGLTSTGGFDPSSLLGPLPLAQPRRLPPPQQGQGGGIVGDVVGKIASAGFKKLFASGAPAVPSIVSATAGVPAVPSVVGASFVPSAGAATGAGGAGTAGLSGLSAAGPAIAALAAAPIAKAIDKATDKSIAEQNRDILRTQLSEFTPLGEERTFLNNKGEMVQLESTDVDTSNPLSEEAIEISDIATDQLLDSLIQGQKDKEATLLQIQPDAATKFLTELPDSERKSQLIKEREESFKEQFRPFLSGMVANSLLQGATSPEDVEENLFSLLEAIGA